MHIHSGGIRRLGCQQGWFGALPFSCNSTSLSFAACARPLRRRAHRRGELGLASGMTEDTFPLSRSPQLTTDLPPRARPKPEALPQFRYRAFGRARASKILRPQSLE